MATIVIEPFTQDQAEEIRRIAAAQKCSQQTVLNWLVVEAMRRGLLNDFRAPEISNNVLRT